jgi:hypothetical protein
MTGEKSRNVLEEDEPGSVPSHKVEEGEGEAGSGAAVGDAPTNAIGIVLSRAPSIA